MSDKKGSSTHWWPKRVFNWSSNADTNSRTPQASAATGQSVADNTSDTMSCVSNESNDGNKYVNQLVKGIHKRLKMRGDEERIGWMSDSNAKECYECGEKFTALRRRHHCRICCQIFCTKCCNDEIDAKLLGFTDRTTVRSCHYCYKIVNQYISDKHLDTTSPTKDKDFNQFREIIFSKNLTHSLTSDQNTEPSLQAGPMDQMNAKPILSPHSLATFRRKSSFGFREEDYAKPKSRALDINSDRMCGSCPSPLLSSYKTTIKTIDSSDDELTPIRSEETSHEPLWVKEINEDKDTDSFEKINISSEGMESSDNYGKEAELRQTKSSVSPSRRMAYSTSTYEIELDFEKDRVCISRADKRDNFDDNSLDDKSKTTTDGINVDFEVTTASSNWELLKDGTEDKFAYDSLNASYQQLYNKLLTQLLEEESLSLSWLNVIQRLSTKIASVVRPNSHNDIDEMDVRNYVKIKTIPNGAKNDSHIVNGLVISKSVVNRRMRQTIINPKILLLSCSIVYQRYEKKLSIMNTIILQEKEYISNIVAKICSYGPDVIFVEKTVARIAKDMLLESGITLVCNVKPVIIERISRFTGAAIVYSLDAQIGLPALGLCQKFYLQTFNQKTLMYLDGCRPQLGSTVLLRGGPVEELKKIKNILSFMVFCDFNWQLERSFLMDEYCYPSLLGDKCHSNVHLNELQLKDSSHKERKVSTCLVDDNSDPLRSMASECVSREMLSPINPNVVEVVTDTNEDNFVTLTTKLNAFLSVLQLSCSPFITISLPYLLTNATNNSKLRKFFDSNIIWSKKFETNLCKESELLKVENALNLQNREQLLSPIEPICVKKHPLLTRNIIIPSNFHEIQSLIADFRANGPFIADIDKRVNQTKVETNIDENDSKNSDKIIRMDALDPKYHQNLSVLFSSFSYASTNSPNYCVKPWIINMDFYGCNDIPLGEFLKRYCFDPTYSCPSNSCSTPMIEHVRRFVHSNACILIVLRQLQQKVDAADRAIITWSWCQKCKTGTPYSTLSSDSWSLSFAKYLELKFYSPQYRRRATASSVACLEHSLHVDHFQFFAYKQVVASFKYLPIHIHEIALPPARVAIFYNPFCKTVFIEDLKQIAIKGYEIYSLILEKLVSIKDETSGTKYELIINEFMVIEANERANFRQKIEEIQLLLTSCNSEPIDDKIVDKMQDFLIHLKKIIAESVYTWNQKIQDFVANKKKEDKLSQKSGAINSASNIMPKPSPVLSASEELNSPPLDGSTQEHPGLVSRNISISSAASLQLHLDAIKDDVNPTGALKCCIEEQEVEFKQTLKALDTIKHQTKDYNEKQELGITLTKDSDRTLSVSSYGYEVDIGINNCLENGVDFEASADNYAVYTIHESIGDNKKQEDNQSLWSTTETKSVASEPIPFTVKRIFKEFLSNATNLTINNAFPLSEHYILPIYKENIAVIVKDDDPASIISYSLTSYEYERQLAELMRQSSSPLLKRKLTASTEMEATIESTISKTSTNPLTQHIDLQYSDSNAKFYCCVYFAEQFRKFRANVLESSEGEELYIRSLSSCIPWKARGGKSGSTFCKTVNDRFILKEMSKPELESFLNIANYYFDYCLSAINESRPSMLARIVGVYRTSYKNTATNNASKLYLLVMENLFYRCNISQKFDLKGSMRNRLVNTNSPNLKADQIVLLDENLMQMTCDCPLYIHSHSKAILRTAIDNDSQFLSSHSVMDYSLLVGIEDESNQFVVGIIDYIRPYTWDKKIESVVKSVGSQGKLPTIVQPDLYRIRFCEAMDQYFLCVPDKWHSILNYS